MNREYESDCLKTEKSESYCLKTEKVKVIVLGEVGEDETESDCIRRGHKE